jgi:CRP-like cAMP-binding protein
VASSKIFEAGQSIYIVGEPSMEMLVLLQGRLVVTSAAGDELGQIPTGTSTGEMGVFTGQLRSANISALDRSVAVIINKAALDSVLASNQNMHVRILGNIVELLSERLNTSNLLNDKLQRRIGELEEELDEQEEPESKHVAEDGVADEFDEYKEED